MDTSLDRLDEAPPDAFNHNLETVPRLYRMARPGADYAGALRLLQALKSRRPQVPTKSGLMLDLGETNHEVLATLADLQAHDCDMLTPASTCSPAGTICPSSTSCPRASSRHWVSRPGPWASTRWPAGLWCAPPTTPIGRPPAGGSPDCLAHPRTPLRAFALIHRSTSWPNSC
jgi:hypothetical protein